MLSNELKSLVSLLLVKIGIHRLEFEESCGQILPLFAEIGLIDCYIWSIIRIEDLTSCLLTLHLMGPK